MNYDDLISEAESSAHTVLTAINNTSPPENDNYAAEAFEHLIKSISYLEQLKRGEDQRLNTRTNVFRARRK